MTVWCAHSLGFELTVQGVLSPLTGLVDLKLNGTPLIQKKSRDEQGEGGNFMLKNQQLIFMYNDQYLKRPFDYYT